MKSELHFVDRSTFSAFRKGVDVKAYCSLFVLYNFKKNAPESGSSPVLAAHSRAMLSRSIFWVALCSMLVLFTASGIQAANITSTQSGDWDAPATWVGGVPPGSNDNVTIAGGHVVTVDVDAAAATIIIEANTGAANGININSGVQLNVGGAIAMTAPTIGTSTISVGAGILNAASIAIPGSPIAGRTCAVTVSTGAITITGSITFTGIAAQAQFVSTGASTVNIAGNFESGGSFITTGTGTVNFNGNTAQTMGAYTTYNNITINKAYGGVTLTGTTLIGGDLTVMAGTFAVGPYALIVSGAASVSGTLSITSATGAKTFTNNVIINNGGLWNNFSGNSAVVIGGNLQNDGAFSAGTGAYTFTGAAKAIGGANTVSLPNLTVNGTITNNGTLAVSVSLAGSGVLTNDAYAILNIGGTSTITTLNATTYPNTVNYNGAAQTVKATGYYHLTLSGSGAKTLTTVGAINGDLTLAGTCSAATAMATSIGGDLIIGTGTTLTVAGFPLTVSGTTSVRGTLAHSSTTGAKTYIGLVTINSGGSWTNTGNSAFTFLGGLTHNGAAFSSGTGVYTFDTNSQTVEGVSALTISNVTVNGITLTNNSTNFTISTVLSGTGELLQGMAATLNIGGTSTITTLNATTYPNIVNYNGAAQTVKATGYYHLTLSGSGAKTLTNLGAINGDLTLAGTCSAATAIATTIGGNLAIGTGTTFTVAGFPLVVTGTTLVRGTITHSSATGAKTYTSLVTINSGGSWTNTGNSAFTFLGGISHNGAAFSSGTGVYTFDTNSQMVEGVSAFTISNVTVNGITLTNNSTNFTVSTSLSGTGELLQGMAATLNIGGTSTITTLNATTYPNTVNYNGAAQTVKATGYYYLTLSGSGVKTLPSETLAINGDFAMTGTVSVIAAAALHTIGSFTIGPSASFNAGSFTHDMKGSFNNSGTFTASNGTVMFTGTSDQSIGGSVATTFNNVIVNKENGTAIVNTTFNVNGMLTFTSGNISTGANAVVISSTGIVSRTSGHVIGNLKKQVSTGLLSQTFEIGDVSSYCPVNISFSGITSGGGLTAKMTAGDHPTIESSTIDSIQSVNKYWTIVNSGIVFTNCDANFNFNAGDIDSGASTDLFKVGRYNGGLWTYPAVGVKTATSTEATALTEFGDFSLGEDRPDSPVLASIDSQSVAVGETLVVGVSATDPDGDSLILSVANLPPNANFSDNGDETGSLNFNPDLMQAGVYEITFIASDLILADSEVVVITVISDSLVISGNAGVAGATLSYIIDTTETVTADGEGAYSFSVPYEWSGTVTPSKTGYGFTPTTKTYANIISNQIDQDFTALVIEDVGRDIDELIPDQFQLAQNYPNPFNPVTTIEYGLPSRAQVTIEVFNVMGQKMKTLVNETKSAGIYRTEWNGIDDAGKLVSTGVYLYRFSAGDIVQKKKMLYLK